MKRALTALIGVSLVAGATLGGSGAATAAPTDVKRSVEAIVMTGAQFPEWSRLPAQGSPEAHVQDGAINTYRDAHNGTIVVPPDARTGAKVGDITAFSYDGSKWAEIPVQVDERFPYFLANGASDFGFYSGTDEELTYAWDVESWKKSGGECFTEYTPEDASKMKGQPTTDPVPTLDDDDEISFMASDAGKQAPAATQGPSGTGAQRQEIAIGDPLNPSAVGYVYLFTKPGGSSFNADTGYVDYQRDANADQWIDRSFYTDIDPEKIGTSNTGYGPNLSGTVCKFNADGTHTVQQSTDRFPRDGVTVTTAAYKWRATGRWMVRNMQVRNGTDANGNVTYGPDLVDRWKGRAFQQSPDSSISVVGFEDEQVNWEANSALIGEITGPVRAIRETWGADSGTNVTKTETFYRDFITYRYRVRVHPIPPDGLYTSWDYNHDKVATYYNELKTDGVAIDGVNDDTGQFDEVPVLGQPAFFDAPDPTFGKPMSFFNWEQVSGKNDNGSLVYMFEIKNPQSFENPLVFPYYRDDSCLDDGTGDNPSQRSYPGESYSWMTDRANDEGASAEQRQVAAEYMARPCYGDPSRSVAGGDQFSLDAPAYKQGCFACHGVHYFFTSDTDNAFSPVELTEIDGQQYQWAAPTAAPANVGDMYANTVKFALRPVAVSQANVAAPEEPAPPVDGGKVKKPKKNK